MPRPMRPFGKENSSPCPLHPRHLQPAQGAEIAAITGVTFMTAALDLPRSNPRPERGPAPQGPEAYGRLGRPWWWRTFPWNWPASTDSRGPRQVAAEGRADPGPHRAMPRGGGVEGARRLRRPGMGWGHETWLRGSWRVLSPPSPRGIRFRWDPVFMPEGHDRTFAQMAAQRKGRYFPSRAACGGSRNCWPEPGLRPVGAGAILLADRPMTAPFPLRPILAVGQPSSSSRPCCTRRT